MRLLLTVTCHGFAATVYVCPISHSRDLRNAMRIHKLLGAISMATLFVAPVHANLLVNGGFETGDLSGWTQEPQFSWNSVFVFQNNLPNFPTYDGIWQLALDTSSRPNPASHLYQDIATTIGDSYTISFALHPNVDRFSSGGFSVATGLNNQLLGSWIPFDFTNTFPNSVELAYQSFSRTFTAVDATTRVSFFWSGSWVLDGTAVTNAAPVPEPSVMLMLASGLVMVMVAVRSRRRNS